MMKIDLRELLLENYELGGEKVALRKIDLNDSLTYDRICEIDRDEEVDRFVMNEEYADEMSPHELKEWVDGRANHVVLGVYGLARHVGMDEAGKLQGELFVEIENEHRVSALKKMGVVPKDEGTIFIEIGYARFPLARNHQMSSGLRSLCRMLGQVFEGKSLYLLGYIEKINVKSEGVLKAAGFTEIGELVYDATETLEKDRVYGLRIG